LANLDSSVLESLRKNWTLSVLAANGNNDISIARPNNRYMKRVEAIVRSERMPIVKEKLRQIGIGGMTILTVSGWSKQRELHLQWRGQPVAYDLLPKVKFEIVLSDEQLDKVTDAIIESARTGEHGDGIIFVSNVEQAFNIATLDKGEKVVL
jgi:nitrogen regulatory protein P-II 1